MSRQSALTYTAGNGENRDRLQTGGFRAHKMKLNRFDRKFLCQAPGDNVN